MVLDFARGTRTPHRNNMAAIQAALEATGIIFIDTDGAAGPGVRLCNPNAKQAENRSRVKCVFYRTSLGF